MTPYLEGFARSRAADIARQAADRHIVEFIPGRNGSKPKKAGLRLVLLGQRTRRERSPNRKVA